MKILYAVQATGNGHITRARVMAPALQQAGVEVDFLFSGRSADKLFNMEPFGDYQLRRGLTFIVRDGVIDRWASLKHNNLVQLIKDIRSLDLQEYDLIISDFEPISAWAAKLQNKPCIGIAHQYAFRYPLPGPKVGRIMMPMIYFFAPVQQSIGLHWHHFDGPILPPLIEPQPYPITQQEGMILVYLPFETRAQIRRWLAPLHDYTFHIYSDIDQPEDEGHLLWRPLSREAFRRAQASCEGVIANSGFGLSSEVLQSGKKLLTKPLSGQPEQQSNAAILKSLRLADVFNELTAEQFYRWTRQPSPKAIVYPDVAASLAGWIAEGCKRSAAQLAQSLWQDV
ncbi:glycosyltransferase family protein [Amphritea sp. 1_MG-2023]|uniref:MJ1255/VC2487 family glycosyltransferase n=1 Tax=Amphritea sp. 1_MG-2023 TaxID=3062670 RepID=UPI0026E2183A|nr:MJ1255/VC2487 family glycosyltransferase [Amphritea sp. 1_MG-2023]MDO6562733.1 glycosyltransferase family protein [Amphritea sp. 1_MG-2023]